MLFANIKKRYFLHLIKSINVIFSNWLRYLKWKEPISLVEEKEVESMVFDLECVQETEEIFLREREEKVEKPSQYKLQAVG